MKSAGGSTLNVLSEEFPLENETDDSNIQGAMKDMCHASPEPSELKKMVSTVAWDMDQMSESAEYDSDSTKV